MAPGKGISFGKLKRILIEEEEEGLPKKTGVQAVDINEEEIIHELLQPRQRNLVKKKVTSVEDVRKIVPYIQEHDIVIVDTRYIQNNEQLLSKIAHNIEGIASAENAKVYRISGCDFILLIIPEDINVIR